MSDKPEIDDLDLSDAEVVELLKNHGIDRRSLMKVLGLGGGLALFGGSATAKSGRGTKIDKVYGASYAAGVHNVPNGLVDHAIELHIHEELPGDHQGFPVGEDGEEPEFFFDPVGVHVKPGEIVAFETHGRGLHTVTAFDPKYNEPPFLVLPDRVPTEYAFTSSLLAEGDAWLYKFREKGVYDLFCLPHMPFGMVMRIVVFDPEDDEIGDATFDEPEPDEEAPLPPNAKMVLENDTLDPADIVSKGEVAWSDLTLPRSL